MDWRIVVSVDLAPAILRKEFQWSVEIPLLQIALPSPKVRKRDLREKKREEITSPPSENLIFIHPDSFLRREVFLSPPPLPPGMGLRPDLVAATMIYGLK